MAIFSGFKLIFSLRTQISIMSNSSIYADKDSNSNDDSSNDSIITGT